MKPSSCAIAHASRQARVVDLVVRHAKRDIACDSIVDEKKYLWHITIERACHEGTAHLSSQPINQDLACGWW